MRERLIPKKIPENYTLQQLSQMIAKSSNDDVPGANIILPDHAGI